MITTHQIKKAREEFLIITKPYFDLLNAIAEKKT